MTELRLAPEYIPSVRSGDKVTTIRAGRRSYPCGPADLVASNERIAIEIIATRIARYEDLTDEDALSDGFSSLVELQAALRRFYPNISGERPVTVVAFRKL